MTDPTDNPAADLLAAVQKLTDPYHDLKIIADDEPGVSHDGYELGTDHKTTARLKRDGLLKQLRNAIVGGIGSHEGAAAGRERIPFDTGAMELYDAIERDITERFVVLLRKPLHLELEATLREWRLAFMDAYDKKRVTDDALHRAVRVMESWATKIENHFDKPKQLEVTINLYKRDPESGEIVTETIDGKEKPVVLRRYPAPCPNCGEAFAHNPKTGDKTFSLLLEYRELGVDTISSATGLCRFCEEVWTAGSGMRELAWQVEEAEAILNTPVTTE